MFPVLITVSAFALQQLWNSWSFSSIKRLTWWRMKGVFLRA
jgi:hypothetical protein